MVRSVLLACLTLVGACLVDIPDPPGGTGSGGSSTSTTSSAGGGTTTTSSTGATVSSGGGGGGSGYRAEVLADGPAGYWRLNETNFPDAFDTSGNGLNGVFIGGVTLAATGALANDADTAVRFDGASWVDLGNVLGLEMKTQFTLEAWILPDGPDPDGGIMGKAVYSSGYGGYLWVVHLGKLRLHRSNYGTGDTNDTMASISTSAFTHVVTTYDGITVRHYLNGRPENAAPGDALIPTFPEPLLIGRVENWGNFTGVIDEVAIYEKVLPEERIVVHYEVGAGLR